MEVNVFGLARFAEGRVVEESSGEVERMSVTLQIEEIGIGDVLFAMNFCVPGFRVTVNCD